MKKLLVASFTVLFLLSSMSTVYAQNNSENLKNIPIEAKQLIENFASNKVSSSVENNVGYRSYRSSRGSKTAQFYRGSFLMWSRDNINFSYDGRNVNSSSAWQEVGWIFPNIARKGSIDKYQSRYNVHKYRASKVIGAGVPTPWGDVKVYEQTFTDYFSVYGSGSYNWDNK